MKQIIDYWLAGFRLWSRRTQALYLVAVALLIIWVAVAITLALVAA